MTYQAAWLLLSYVPGTAQWKAYRATVQYVNDAQDLADEVLPGNVPFPQPIPRSPEACELAVEAMTAMLRACKAWADGGDPAAVFGEHMPTFPYR